MNINGITIDKNEWEEIPQTKYKRIKREFPDTCNSFTARFRFKYYKRKEKKFPKYFKSNKYGVNDLYTVYPGTIFLGDEKGNEFYIREDDIPILQEALKYWEDNK